MILNATSTYLILALAIFGSAQAQNADTAVCDGITCNNKGFCVPSTLYNSGYWCECDDGWVGQTCAHPQPTVVCGDHEITISIDSGIVEELKLELDEKFIYFGNTDSGGNSMDSDDACQAIFEQDKFKLKLKAPFDGCGTELLSKDGEDDFTFSNTVVWNSEFNNTNIDRELVLLDFKCIYADEFTVMGANPLPPINQIKYATERGSFKIAMSIYEDNSYAQDKEYTDSPSIGIGTYVYAQVELEEVEDPHLVVTMDDCYATQTRDPSDVTTVKHFLIKSRCIDNDPTVEVYQNGQSHQSRFKFQMFKWRWSADPIFLHCEVDVCNKTSEECTGSSNNCNGQDAERKKRDLEIDGEFIHDYQSSNTVLTMGPLMVAVSDILIENANSPIVQEVDTTMVYLGLSLGLVLAVLGAIVGAMLRKRRQLTRNMAEEVAVNRLTNLRFTREAF
jgi:hypothetical protein